MKLFATVEFLKDREDITIIRLISLTQKRPTYGKGKDVFSVVIDDGLKGNNKRIAGVRELSKITALPVFDYYSKYCTKF